jgi:hypothetical protein
MTDAQWNAAHFEYRFISERHGLGLPKNDTYIVRIRQEYETGRQLAKNSSPTV